MPEIIDRRGGDEPDPREEEVRRLLADVPVPEPADAQGSQAGTPAPQTPAPPDGDPGPVPDAELGTRDSALDYAARWQEQFAQQLIPLALGSENLMTFVGANLGWLIKHGAKAGLAQTAEQGQQRVDYGQYLAMNEPEVFKATVQVSQSLVADLITLLVRHIAPPPQSRILTPPMSLVPPPSPGRVQ